MHETDEVTSNFSTVATSLKEIEIKSLESMFQHETEIWESPWNDANSFLHFMKVKMQKSEVLWLKHICDFKQI